MKTRIFSAALGLLFVLAMTIGTSGVAQAHALLLRADPADGAQLGAAPQELRLWLSQPVNIGQGDVLITTTDGRQIAPSTVMSKPYVPSQSDLADLFDPAYLYLCSVGAKAYPSLVTITLPALVANTYKVSWHAIALDDHWPTAGVTVFTVQAPGQATDQKLASQPARLATAITRAANDLMVVLDVKPNQPGQNFILIDIFNTRRPAPATIDSVEIQLSAPDGTATMLPAVALGKDRYQISGDMLAAAGAWTFGVVIHRAHMPDAMATLPWQVATPHTSAETDMFNRLPADLIFGGLAGVLLLGVILLSLRRWRLLAGQTHAQLVPEPITASASRKE